MCWLQVERVGEGGLRALHTAYSSLVVLNRTHAAMVYERGPMAPWHTKWGEYESIRWHAFALPAEDDTARRPAVVVRWPLGSEPAHRQHLGHLGGKSVATPTRNANGRGE